MTTPTSAYYTKAFCVKCLTDCNRTGGVWRIFVRPPPRLTVLRAERHERCPHRRSS